MKNKDFFYLQYDKINWQNQDKTKINAVVNNYIIDEIIGKFSGRSVRVFDIGFGIGFFIRMLYKSLSKKFDELVLEGCEPSEKNYNYFTNKTFTIRNGVELRTHNKPILDVSTDTKFDFVTSIYVFPHFLSEELSKVVAKIKDLLVPHGKFILVVADDVYLEKKLQSNNDLFIERGVVEINGKKYKEVLHYTDIPGIGKVIDYNREKQLYLDLFSGHGFELASKKILDDNGFICSIYIFEKK